MRLLTQGEARALARGAELARLPFVFLMRAPGRIIPPAGWQLGPCSRVASPCGIWVRARGHFYLGALVGGKEGGE